MSVMAERSNAKSQSIAAESEPDRTNSPPCWGPINGQTVLPWGVVDAELAQWSGDFEGLRHEPLKLCSPGGQALIRVTVETDSREAGSPAGQDAYRDGEVLVLPAPTSCQMALYTLADRRCAKAQRRASGG